MLVCDTIVVCQVTRTSILHSLVVASCLGDAFGHTNCWWGGFSHKACCHSSYGATGNTACWDRSHTYEGCCLEEYDNTKEAREEQEAEVAISTDDKVSLGRLRDALGTFGASARLLAQLSRLEALPAEPWWKEQRALLELAEAPGPLLPPGLVRLPRVGFALLLEALTPVAARSRFALNIGAGDGKTHDPVYPLFSEHGYAGLVMEAHPAAVAALLETLSPFNATGELRICAERVRPPAVRGLLKRFAVPRDLDALKIDIDSFDLPVMRAVLQAGYLPKVVAMEINPDIPPPLRWHMEYSPNFRLNFAGATWKGVYGASPDALFALLTSWGYSLVGFELISARERCPLCEHNMWFVRNDLVGQSHSQPLVSWWGMVRLFWAQVELLNSQCLHVHLSFSCPLQDLEALTLGSSAKKVAHARRLPQAGQSLALALPGLREVSLAYGKAMQQALAVNCRNVGGAGWLAVSQAIACLGVLDVSRVAGAIFDEEWPVLPCLPLVTGELQVGENGMLFSSGRGRHNTSASVECRTDLMPEA